MSSSLVSEDESSSSDESLCERETHFAEARFFCLRGLVASFVSFVSFPFFFFSVVVVAFNRTTVFSSGVAATFLFLLSFSSTGFFFVVAVVSDSIVSLFSTVTFSSLCTPAFTSFPFFIGDCWVCVAGTNTSDLLSTFLFLLGDCDVMLLSPLLPREASTFLIHSDGVTLLFSLPNRFLFSGDFLFECHSGAKSSLAESTLA